MWQAEQRRTCAMDARMERHCRDPRYPPLSLMRDHTTSFEQFVAKGRGSRPNAAAERSGQRAAVVVGGTGLPRASTNAVCSPAGPLPFLTARFLPLCCSYHSRGDCCAARTPSAAEVLSGDRLQQGRPAAGVSRQEAETGRSEQEGRGKRGGGAAAADDAGRLLLGVHCARSTGAVQRAGPRA